MLIVIVNDNYEIIMVDVGTNGSVLDGGVLHNNEFEDKLNNNALNIPSPEVVTDTSRNLEYVFIEDDVFSMGEIC